MLSLADSRSCDQWCCIFSVLVNQSYDSIVVTVQFINSGNVNYSERIERFSLADALFDSDWVIYGDVAVCLSVLSLLMCLWFRSWSPTLLRTSRWLRLANMDHSQTLRSLTRSVGRSTQHSVRYQSLHDESDFHVLDLFSKLWMAVLLKFSALLVHMACKIVSENCELEVDLNRHKSLSVHQWHITLWDRYKWIICRFWII